MPSAIVDAELADMRFAIFSYYSTLHFFRGETIAEEP